MKIILEVGTMTEEIQKKIEEFAKSENITCLVPEAEQEVLVMPTDIYKQKSIVKAKIVKKEKAELLKQIEEFIDEHLVEFKKAEVEIPSYLTLHTDSEYDDNGGTYEYLSGVTFFNAKKERIDCDFEIEGKWGESVLEEEFVEEFRDEIDLDNFEDMFQYGEYIAIPRGE